MYMFRNHCGSLPKRLPHYIKKFLAVSDVIYARESCLAIRMRSPLHFGISCQFHSVYALLSG